MNNKLITALRTAANAVENWTFNYNWNNTNSCNCGVVICSVLGLSQSQLIPKLPKAFGGESATWTKLAGQYCPITGAPEHELFKELFTLGLTAIEIRHLEFLSDPIVRARMKKRTVRTGWLRRKREIIERSNREDLVSYLRAWADILQERGADDAVPVDGVEAEPVSFN